VVTNVNSGTSNVHQFKRIMVTARKAATTGMINRIPYDQITSTAGVLNSRGARISMFAFGFKGQLKSTEVDKWSKMARFALEESAPASVSHKLAFADRDLPTHRDEVRPSLDRHAFEGVIIDIHTVSLSRDRAAVIGIVNDQVRI
jgi:hypothetical protein